jgi:hypothetical protein
VVTDTEAGTSSRAAASFCSISRSEVAQERLARERHRRRADRRPHARLLDDPRDREQRVLAHRYGDPAVERGPGARRAVEGDEHAADRPAVGNRR